MALISAEKRIVLVFFALYYKLKQLRPPRYRFCKVYFCPNKCRKAHSSRACNFILRNKQATTFYILYVTISIFFIFLFIFHILLKLTLKSPYVGISNLVKNVIFFYHFTNVSKFEILFKKKTIEKDAVFTIDNLIVKIFHKTNVIFSKKSIFQLIMTSNIFPLKIIFYIEKMISKKIWSSKKSFPSNVEP